MQGDNSKEGLHNNKPFYNSRLGYILLTLFLCSISFFIAWFIFHSDKNTEQKLINNSNKFVYRTEVVKLVSDGNVIESMGNITYDENNVVRIYPIVSGEVEDVKVSLGAYVKRGEDLAKIRSVDVSDFIKQNNIAKTNFELAKKNLRIKDSLYKSGFSSSLEVLNSKNEFKKANDEYTKTKEVLDLYNLNSSTTKPIYSIKSSIDGYVVEKNITNTMIIRPDNGTNLFTISDLSKVWVYANVFEDNISKVKKGQSVTIVPLAYDEEIEGKIDNISSILDKNSKVLKVRIVIENKNGQLKPDMAVNIKIHVPDNIKIHVPDNIKHLAVPPNALIFDKDNYYVLEKKNGKVLIRQVELHSKNSKFSFIKSGIQQGDTIVTQGSLLLYNQMANNL